MKHRWWIYGVGLLLVGYTVAIAFAIYQPPLAVCNPQSGVLNGKRLIGLNLCNDGWVTVTLIKFTIESGDPPDTVEAASSEALPSSAALQAIKDESYVTGPVNGWSVAVDGKSPKRNGLILTWPLNARLPEAVTITYRYLGWPMTVRSPLDLWPQVH
jgi:hypothetical protein